MLGIATHANAENVFETAKIISKVGYIPHNFVYQISPDNQKVVFLSGNQILGSPIAGGTTPVVLANLPEIDGFRFITLSFNTDSTRVIYNANQKVFSVPINGGIPQQLSQNPAQNQRLGSVRITPDGQHVVYDSDQFDPYRLFSAPVNGGTRKQLNSAT